MKFLLVLVLLTAQAFAHEKVFRTRADKFASAEFTQRRNHQWPFPLLSIGHNMQSPQNYDGSPYWHDGLDIRGQADQAVYATAGGLVVNIENYIPGQSAYWEVAIQDRDGFVWKYHHIAKTSIPEEIRAAYTNRTPVQAGTLIGNIVRWPISSYGEVYHHLHLLVVAADGKYVNPLLLLSPLPDTIAPVISLIGIAQNHTPVQGTSVRGPHALFLEASDLILHQRFIVPPHKISYRLDHGPEKVVWEFTYLPSGKNDTDFINDFYFKGTCGNYSCRRFFFNLNFSQQRPRDVMNLPAGPHQVDVTVEDTAGNRTSRSFVWTVL